ncbi:MAG: hypothetical protein FJZ87_01460 [Chloroflexi bacterium]|nr:hypothetical protein [Chloroflexota bacterium]
MAVRAWKIEKIKYCEHAGHEIALENEVVYPPEFLPDQPPRILARRCSNVLECNMLEKAACLMCGTNPDLDPV